MEMGSNELKEALDKSPNERMGETSNTPKPEVSIDDKKPLGLLFDSIAYNSVSDIPHFIEDMTINDSAMVVLSAATFAHKKGVLTLLESEVLSKAIRIFTTPRTPVVPPEVKIEQPVPKKD